jgi:hypothetical protein
MLPIPGRVGVSDVRSCKPRMYPSSTNSFLLPLLCARAYYEESWAAMPSCWLRVKTVEPVRESTFHRHLGGSPSTPTNGFGASPGLVRPSLLLILFQTASDDPKQAGSPGTCQMVYPERCRLPRLCQPRNGRPLEEPTWMLAEPALKSLNKGWSARDSCAGS